MLSACTQEKLGEASRKMNSATVAGIRCEARGLKMGHKTHSVQQINKNHQHNQMANQIKKYFLFIEITS